MLRRLPFRFLNQTVLWLILAVLALTTVAPFLWMIATSFKHVADVFSPIPSFLPVDQTTGKIYFTLENYTFVYSYAGLDAALLNSLYVIVILIPLKLFFDALAAYAFARIPFKGNKLLFNIVLTSIMVPGIALLIPRVYVTKRLVSTIPSGA